METNNTAELAKQMSEMCGDCDEYVEHEEKTIKQMRAHLVKAQGEMIEEKNKLSDSLVVLKRERVTDQKKIIDLQRRLGFAMDEYEQDKSKLIRGDTLMGVDLNSEENYMKCKVDDIMVSLKDKIIASSRCEIQDPETNKFLNKISITTSQRGSLADSPKRVDNSSGGSPH